MNVYDAFTYARTPCLGRTAEARLRVQQFHSQLWGEARHLLRLLAAAEEEARGASWTKEPWLAAALRFGEPGPPQSREEQEERIRHQVLLRSMAYGNAADTGGSNGIAGHREPRWTVQKPHQDATWLSLIVESSSGLLTLSGQQDRREEPWSLARGSAMNLIVLVGGRLAEASHGFYPASCHGVAYREGVRGTSPAPPPRFSWILLYTSNCCDFYELPGLLSCGWGLGSARRPFSIRGMPTKAWCLDSEQDSCRIWTI